MKKEHKYFDDLVRKKMSEFSETPPPHVWDRIKESKKSAKSKRLVWIFRVSAVAAVIVFAFLLIRQITIQPDTDNKITTVPGDSKESGDVQKNIASKNLQEGIDDPVLKDMESNQENMIGKQIKEDSQHDHFPENLAEIEKSKPEKLSTSKLDSKDGKLLSSEWDTEEKQLAYVNIGASINDRELIEANLESLKSKDRENTDSWQVAALVSPNLSVNNISNNESYTSNMTSQGSKDYFSFGGGLVMSYKAGKRWSVQSGVYYSKLRQNSSNQSSSSQSNIIETAGFEQFTAISIEEGGALVNAPVGVIEYDQLPENTVALVDESTGQITDATFNSLAEFEQNFEYVEVPFNLRYWLTDSKLHMNLLGGVSSNWLISNKVIMKDETGTKNIGQTREMNKINFSATFGVGLGYGISNKISLHIEPQIKYFLGSLNKNSSVGFQPYTLGIYTGFSYKF